MQEISHQERILPCLLDRLIDEAPAEKTESRAQRVFSIRTYRESVRRDIASLLNSHARLDAAEIERFPTASSSVLNYGIRDLCGICASTLDMSDLERHIASAIRLFEPRLIPHTVKVKSVVAEKDKGSPSVVGFEVRGDLWARPIPEHWFCKTEIDLESGIAAVGT